MNQISTTKIKPWQGKLNLAYQYQEGKTTIKDVYSQAPFKMQRAFYPEGKSICHTFLVHTAGGIVGGDSLLQNIHLLENSQVLMTTPTASRIYRSNGQTAVQEINLSLDKNSYLEYLPQETIVFNQAQFQQKMKVKLGENASFLTWEINRFGRTARGEDFREGRWQNYLEIWRENKPIWIDRKKLEGEANHFYTLNGLNQQPIVGSLIFVANSNVDNLVTSLRDLLENKAIRATTSFTVINTMIICRYHGKSNMECKQNFLSIWQLLRESKGLNGQFNPRIWR